MGILFEMNKNNQPIELILIILTIPSAYFLIIIQIKRWHDLNKPGTYVLLNLIPLIGALVSFVMLGFVKGNIKQNKFGESSI